MNALSTMLLISDAFVELCDEMPLRKVSISDIVERTGKNRPFSNPSAVNPGTIVAVHCKR